MPYYKLERGVGNLKDSAQLGSEGGLNILVDPEGGQLMIHSKKQLPEAEGLEKITKRTFDAAHRKLTGSAEQATPIRLSLAGMDRLETVEEWRVESYSLRQADFAVTAVTAGVPAMRIRFGAGRGNTIQIGRPLKLSAEAQHLVLKAYAWCPDGDSVAVGPAFTTERERPWLEIAPQDISLGESSEIQFDLTGLDDQKLTKTDRLNLVFNTKADEGFVMIERLYLAK